MVVGVLVFIDVATLTTWQVIDPFYRDTSQGNPEVGAGCQKVAVFLSCLCYFVPLVYRSR